MSDPKLTIDDQLCWLHEGKDHKEQRASVVFDVGVSGTITTKIILDDAVTELHLELDSGAVIVLAAAIRERRRKT